MDRKKKYRFWESFIVIDSKWMTGFLKIYIFREKKNLIGFLVISKNTQTLLGGLFQFGISKKSRSLWTLRDNGGKLVLV